MIHFYRDLGRTLGVRIRCPFIESPGSLSTSPLPSCNGMFDLTLLGCVVRHHHASLFFYLNPFLYFSSTHLHHPLDHFPFSSTIVNCHYMSFDVYHLSSIPVHLSVSSHFAHSIL